MNRTPVRRRRSSVLALSAVLVGVWAGPVANALESGGAASQARERYVIREGDTLWSIAKRLAPGEDPRPLVDSISAANGIDPGALLPGRTLLIPAAD